MMSCLRTRDPGPRECHLAHGSHEICCVHSSMVQTDQVWRSTKITERTARSYVYQIYWKSFREYLLGPRKRFLGPKSLRTVPCSASRAASSGTST
jgi:hypothetical protein